MPNRGDRGGSLTRARIAAVATELFVRRGFEDVTIADVAAAAGVSRVTVFKHFERKEDLLLDQLPAAIDLVRSAIRNRGEGTGALEAIGLAAMALADERHALSGLTVGVEPFMRTVLASPALLGRLRGFEREIENVVAAELAADPGFSGDSALAAALLVAAYRTVAAGTIARRLDGGDLSEIAAAHRRRLREAFATVRHGLPG